MVRLIRFRLRSLLMAIGVCCLLLTAIVSIGTLPTLAVGWLVAVFAAIYASVRFAPTWPVAVIWLYVTAMVAAFAGAPILLFMPGKYDEASRVMCVRNFEHIAAAVRRREGRNGRQLLAYRADSGGMPLLSWQVELLPEVGEYALLGMIALNKGWDSKANGLAITQMPPIDSCPSEDACAGCTSYFAVVKSANDTGAVPRIWAIIEAIRMKVPWTKPVYFTCAEAACLVERGGLHSGGTHVLFVESNEIVFYTHTRELVTLFREGKTPRFPVRKSVMPKTKPY